MPPSALLQMVEDLHPDNEDLGDIMNRFVFKQVSFWYYCGTLIWTFYTFDLQLPDEIFASKLLKLRVTMNCGLKALLLFKNPKLPKSIESQ